MHIALVAVGRCRKAYIKEGVQDYAKRIGHYATFDQFEVSDERSAKGLQINELARREGERILRATPKGFYTVALDVAGQATDSDGLANRLSDLGLGGRNRVAFWVGGAFGLSGEVIQEADWRLSLSEMTLPHELARLVLLEQIYRAFTIIRGENYHK